MIATACYARRGRVALAALVVGVAVISPSAARAAPDVTAPDIPAGIFVDEGSSWRAANYFRVWWHNPAGQESAITTAHYEICSTTPSGACTTHQATGDDISELEVTVPHAGGFWIRVWLEDGAGNVNPDVKSAHTILRFDDGVPPEAVIDHVDAWLGRDTAIPELPVGIRADADWPISGIRGYSITLDGSTPDSEVDAFAVQDYERFHALYVVPSLLEGTAVISIRSISNTGIPSAAIGTFHLRLDRTSPVLSGDGMPEANRWYRSSLSVPLDAHDQANLSGMTPAPPENFAHEGAYLEYKLDDSPALRIRGAHGEVPITTDGHHTLAFRAFDVAGNGSVEKEVAFKIDATAPVGAFRPLDGADPRQLRVDVADATSGVADGHIEYRREGGGGFQRLATARQGGVLSARLEDELLPPGRYQLRAVVTDVAGNEAVVDDWADGTAATLGMPLRSEAKVSVARDSASVKRCAKASKRRGGRGKKRRRLARPRCGRKALPKASAELGYGKAARSTGSVMTGGGVPIVDAPVIVEGQARSGGAFVALGVARTDRHGKFRFEIPAGPSRTVRYRYDGTNTVKPATAQLMTKVRAAARLKVDRRWLRNGQAVRFTGQLLGRPVPSAGKLVALQAKVGRRWRTFATPRANAKGVFRHRYRFTATTGLRRYAFRAVVARETAYPYERGVSRTLTVSVRGR